MMYGEIKFMSGIDPVGVKERELAIAEKRSHSARIAHKRRRDQRAASSHSQKPNGPRPVHVDSLLDHSDHVAGNQVPPLAPSVLPRRTTPYSTSSSEQQSPSEEPQSSAATTPEFKIVPYRQISSAYAITRQPQSNIHLVFNNNPDWLQAFDFWIKVSGPATARYASPYGEVWTKILPQFAMTSTTVRHMLLAHAYIYAMYYRAFSAGASTFEARALYHYSKGVKEMCTKVSGQEFLAAAKFGYIFEAMQDNLKGARLHLRGSEAIVSNYKKHKNETFQLLAASHEVANTITSIMEHKIIETGENKAPHTVPGKCALFDTTDDARHMIGSIIERIGDTFSPDDDIAWDEIKTSLRGCLGALRKWDAQDAPLVKRTALILLFNLATALLPATATGRLSQAANPHLIQYILDSAVEYLDKHRNMSAEDRKDLMTTLRMLANYTIRFVHLPEHQARSKLLLDRIESAFPYPVAYE